MNDRKYQIIGLVGFFLSGLVFAVSGIVNGDRVIVLASLLWIFSCIAWFIPLL